MEKATAWHREREREEKPGDMKHTETNKSRPFAYCCILMRWLQQYVLDVVHHDGGKAETEEWEGGERAKSGEEVNSSASCFLTEMMAAERDRERRRSRTCLVRLTPSFT